RSASSLIADVALQADGGIVPVGNFATVNNETRLGAARFVADAGQSGGGGGGGGGGTGSVSIQSPALDAQGQFSMKVPGATGHTYRIDASTDLRAWAKVGSITGNTAAQPFTDSDSKTMPKRFYRVVPE